MALFSLECVNFSISLGINIKKKGERDFGIFFE